MVYGYSQIELISGCLIFFLTTISLAATLVTLWLIYDMNRWNGYMLLIFNLTLCQALYDISFYFLLLSTFAGLSVTLWTNIISFILLYIVITMRSFHIYSYFRRFFIGIFTISALVASLEVGFFQHNNHKAMNRVEHNYYYFRIFSILFNIAIHFIISFRLYRMGLIYNSNAFHRSGTLGGASSFANFKTAINDPLKTLAGRLKYYPMVQICTWIGAAWYEFEYGFTISSFDGQGHKSTMQLVCIYVDAICSPSAGLGFFIIFLVVQPTAYAHLVFHIKKACHCLRPEDNLRHVHKRSFANNSDFMYSRTKSSESTVQASSTMNPHHHFNELLIAGGSGNSPAPDDRPHNNSGDDRQDSSEVCDELDEDELALQMEDKYSIQGSNAGAANSSNSGSGTGGGSYLFSGSGLGALGSLGSGSHFSSASNSNGARSHSTTRRLMSDDEKSGAYF